MLVLPLGVLVLLLLVLVVLLLLDVSWVGRLSQGRGPERKQGGEGQA
jgi:hypothetical protein